MSNISTKYQIGKTLGRGQFGVTKLAVHRSSKKEFAVKSIPKKRLVSQRDIESLKREVTIMHLLAGHPNIIDVKKVYEVSPEILLQDFASKMHYCCKNINCLN